MPEAINLILNKPETSLPQLENIAFDLPAPPTKEHPLLPKHTQVKDFILNGKHLRCEIVTKGSHTMGDFAQLSFEFSVKLEDAIARSKLSLYKNDKDKEWQARGDVSNPDRTRTYPELGKKLWLLYLRTIQNFSNATGFPVSHEITKAPHDGLTGEKWDKIFLAALHENGYHPTPDLEYAQEWRKKYQPETTA